MLTVVDFVVPCSAESACALISHCVSSTHLLPRAVLGRGNQVCFWLLGRAVLMVFGVFESAIFPFAGVIYVGCWLVEAQQGLLYPRSCWAAGMYANHAVCTLRWSAV